MFISAVCNIKHYVFLIVSTVRFLIKEIYSYSVGFLRLHCFQCISNQNLKSLLDISLMKSHFSVSVSGSNFVMPLLLYTLFFTLRLTVLLFRIGISVRSRKTINPLRESLSARWSQPLTIHDADLRHSPESMSLTLASSLWCGTVNQWEGLYADCKWIKKIAK